MKDRSFFWPLTLIAAGVIWLLVSMQIIPASNLWALTRIWPYVLILLGLGLIVRSFWKFGGGVVSTLVVLGAVGAILFAPQLGWASGPDLSWGEWGIDSEIGGAIPGSGQIETSTREVSDFDVIAIQYPAEMVIRQGEVESIRIEADDNLLPQLSAEVDNGTLVFENSERSWNQRVNPTRSVKVTVTVKDLRRVDFRSAGRVLVDGLTTEELQVNLSGAGEVVLDDLQAGSLAANLSGAGNFEADGQADDVQLVISGMGSFDAPDLKAQTAEVRISGAGSATLRVEDDLNASVSGAGSINYYGSPHVTRTISGAGSVNQAGD